MTKFKSLLDKFGLLKRRNGKEDKLIIKKSKNYKIEFWKLIKFRINS